MLVSASSLSSSQWLVGVCAGAARAASQGEKTEAECKELQEALGPEDTLNCPGTLKQTLLSEKNQLLSGLSYTHRGHLCYIILI